VDDYIDTNRRHWDELVGIHVRSEFYDVTAFKAGRSSLLSLEREEVGDVRGKTLLHLQCHFGLDTLSWAREGAIATGVDFSGEAIAVARQLSRDIGIAARFIEADVYKLPEALGETFDIVFASYGVVCWLPDFPRWAKVAASLLKPGGVFYLVDGHPLGNALAQDSDAAQPRFDFPYFAGDAVLLDDDGSYADSAAQLQNRRTFEFAHDLGEMVTSLADAGLQIEFLHEFPFAGWQRVRQMEKGADGFWRLPGGAPQLPFLFSIRATLKQTI
jgi:SAM-dependent methyltransferase